MTEGECNLKKILENAVSISGGKTGGPSLSDIEEAALEAALGEGGKSESVVFLIYAIKAMPAEEHPQMRRIRKTLLRSCMRSFYSYARLIKKLTNKDL